VKAALAGFCVPALLVLGPSCACPLRHAGKKKAQDPFTRKDWYDIKAPSMFSVRQIGKSLVTRTTGTKVRGLILAQS
jgi:hypothetical protein